MVIWKVKKLQKRISEVRKKTRQNRKKKQQKVYFMPKSIECAHRKYKKVMHTYNKTELQNTRNHSSLLDKWNVAKVHSWEFVSWRRCFLSFHLKVKVVERHTMSFHQQKVSHSWVRHFWCIAFLWKIPVALTLQMMPALNKKASYSSNSGS